MLSQLKEARMTVEKKLLSQKAEMKYLKQENEKTKRLLEMSDKENENLRRMVS